MIHKDPQHRDKIERLRCERARVCACVYAIIRLNVHIKMFFCDKYIPKILSRFDDTIASISHFDPKYMLTQVKRKKKSRI